MPHTYTSAHSPSRILLLRIVLLTLLFCPLFSSLSEEKAVSLLSFEQLKKLGPSFKSSSEPPRLASDSYAATTASALEFDNRGFGSDFDSEWDSKSVDVIDLGKRFPQRQRGQLRESSTQTEPVQDEAFDWDLSDRADIETQTVPPTRRASPTNPAGYDANLLLQDAIVQTDQGRSAGGGCPGSVHRGTSNRHSFSYVASS